MRPLKRPPAPSSLSMFWNALGTGDNAYPMLFRLFQKYGDIVWLRGPGGGMYLVSNPAFIKHFLVDNAASNYPKNYMAPQRGIVLGASLSTTEGAEWLRHRRMAQPGFQRDRLLASVPKIVKSIRGQLEERWEPKLRSGEPLEVFPAMSRLVVSTLGQLACSEEFPDDVCEAVFQFMVYAVRPRTRVERSQLPRKLMNLYYQRFQPQVLPAARRIDTFAWEVVRRRMALAEQPDDMLGLMINARDEKGEPMKEQEVRDEFVELFFGGQVSTGIALSFMWHLLALHPEVRERLVDEVDRTLNGREPTAEDLKQLRYVSQVFEETLRLHPPAPGISRPAIKDDTLGGYDVPAGTMVSASSYVMHRHPEFWTDPERFDPERFSAEKAQARPRFAYMPFGGGQRVCIGAMLASLIATSASALVAQRYRLEHVPGKKMRLMTGTTHFPANLWMKLLPARATAPDTSLRSVG
ncbi:cytochrome P450 [Pyxidicoccus trucidator]|uniref:cytochrome P450 n=1 Tax=Pyxidicoccus trucidator TaxID=2709662 RepID=UPI001967ABE4|nr:cytochrome P450 [Pyxidicoccus trucidator]